MPRVLELFAGTGSIGNAFAAQDFEVISVDLESTFGPTHVCDVMHFEYWQYPKDFFDVVWASPPCQMYSIARTRAKLPRNMEIADEIVLKAREIIAYFNPKYWFIENPFSGHLKRREIMQDVMHLAKKVSYCMYGKPYRKTR